MTLAGKMYFDAVSKIGENAAVSPVSRELGEYQAYLYVICQHFIIIVHYIVYVIHEEQRKER